MDDTKNNVIKFDDSVIRKDPIIKEKYISALYDIRLKLSIKNISSPTIKKEDLKKILDESKVSANDKMVSDAIDDFFEEYFVDKKGNKEENYLSTNEMKNIIDKEIDNNSFADSAKSNNGIVKSLNNGNFKNTNDTAA